MARSSYRYFPCCEDDPSLIFASPFTIKEEICGGKASTRQAEKEATTR